jgi:XTP/dITP diphosphohydrolase
MEGLSDDERAAYFVSVIVFLRHAQDPLPIIAQGLWDGRIVTEPIGEGGFGYDPLFWVPSHGCTSAQLDPEVKNAISHRGQAMMSLLEQLSVGNL